MKITIPVCILCESEDVQLWTLDNGGLATVTWICGDHAAPLMEIMDASEGLPLDMQIPVVRQAEQDRQRNRDLMEARREAQKNRTKPMIPLLDWTPPSEQVVNAESVSGDVGGPVQLPDDAAEVGAGGQGDDLGVAGAAEVHDPGLQSLQGSYSLDGLEHEGSRTHQVA